MFTQSEQTILKEWHSSVEDVIAGCDPVDIFPERYAPGWALGDFVEREPVIKRLPSMKQLAMIVSEECDLDYNIIMSSRSDRSVVTARQIGMVLMREYLGKNLSEIGRFYGRDWTCVRSARDSLSKKRRANDDVEYAFKRCLARVTKNPSLVTN